MNELTHRRTANAAIAVRETSCETKRNICEYSKQFPALVCPGRGHQGCAASLDCHTRFPTKPFSAVAPGEASSSCLCVGLQSRLAWRSHAGPVQSPAVASPRSDAWGPGRSRRSYSSPFDLSARSTPAAEMAISMREPRRVRPERAAQANDDLAKGSTSFTGGFGGRRPPKATSLCSSGRSRRA
jgi:hypothetical protein